MEALRIRGKHQSIRLLHKVGLHVEVMIDCAFSFGIYFTYSLFLLIKVNLIAFFYHTVSSDKFNIYSTHS